MAQALKKRVILLFLAACILPLFSCAPGYGRFKLTDKDFRPRGKSLAVLSGLDNDANVILSEYMAEAFKNRSTFQVLSGQEIKRVMPDYPINIKGPYKNAYFSFDVDYARTDVKKLKSIQQKLGVDYLYVLWAPSTYGSEGETVINFLMIAQLFASPDARQIGNIDGQILVQGKSFFFGRNKPGAEQFSKQLMKVTGAIATDIAGKTGMERQEKE